ncbi:cell division protein FtsL [Agitococcus lubricus]|uniref:Cell division protein FtsL n=1 Tax=Agitococcus lubricus TaxID=1077255 RepID=A0A2T5J0L0_9GAMM|nr:cell division protein FtsL [Agitococcus lubricus]PTQ89879.1 cell division protein FtsL [Agitococcus lubricus]
MMWSWLKKSFHPSFDAIVAIILVIAVIGSAIAVAFSVHHTREALQELQELREQRKALDVEWGQLLLEQHSWGAYGNVDQIAKSQLQMQPANLHDIVMVQP